MNLSEILYATGRCNCNTPCKISSECNDWSTSYGYFGDFVRFQLKIYFWPIAFIFRVSQDIALPEYGIMYCS